MSENGSHKYEFVGTEWLNPQGDNVTHLSARGVDYTNPTDTIKDPYVFEFLGIPEDKPMLERDLEKAFVRRIEDFLLELGNGFMFVGTQ